MRAVLVLAVVTVVAVACNPEGPPPVAPVELSVPPMASASAGSPIAKGGGPPPSGGADNRCTARLAPEPIQTGSGCELDERLTRGPGQLFFPCKGDGEIEATFDEHRFSGTLRAGTAELHLRTELEWSDRCLWETEQHLRGKIDIANGHARSGTLVWSYSERSVRPPPGGGSCLLPCKAKAEILVE